jgi:hypothetical protein
LWGAEKLRGVVPAMLVGAAVTMSWLVPYVVNAPGELAASGAGHGQSSGAVSGLLSVLSDPSRLRVNASGEAVAFGLEFLLGHPYELPWVRWAILAGGIVILVACRNVALLAISAGAIAAAVLVFSLWQGPFGEGYWFMVIGPAGAICLIAPIAATRRALRIALTVGAALVVALLQPARAAEAWHTWRVPQYGALVSGARAVVARGTRVREIHPDFDVPPGADVYFLHALWGGRLDVTGAVAQIAPNGEVTYAP